MNWTVNLSELTAPATLLIAVLLVLIGQLIPRWVVSQIKKDFAAQLGKADTQIKNLEAALAATIKAREVQATQLGYLLELAKTTDAFIRSLQQAGLNRESNT